MRHSPGSPRASSFRSRAPESTRCRTAPHCRPARRIWKPARGSCRALEAAPPARRSSPPTPSSAPQPPTPGEGRSASSPSGGERWSLPKRLAYRGPHPGEPLAHLPLVAAHQYRVLERLLGELAQLGEVLVQHLDLFHTGDRLALGRAPDRKF